MSAVSAIKAGAAAVKKGQILAHPERWKNAQVVIAGAVAVGMAAKEIACILNERCFGLTDASIQGYAQAAAWLLFGAYNAWTTFATSTKVGVGKHPAPADIVLEQSAQLPPANTKHRVAGERHTERGNPFFDDQ